MLFLIAMILMHPHGVGATARICFDPNPMSFSAPLVWYHGFGVTCSLAASVEWGAAFDK